MSKNLEQIRVCLIGATFSTKNMGVSALTAGAIKCVLHNYPNAQIYLLDYGREKQIYEFNHLGKVAKIELINLRFSKKFYLKNNIAFLIFVLLFQKLIPFKNIVTKIEKKNYYLTQLSKINIFASISGGDSFSDIYGINRFFYVALPQFLILLMGKSLILLPQTLGPFKKKITKILATYILNKACLVYSRDYTGLKEMNELLGEKYNSHKYRFCYDLGFVLDPIKPAELITNHPIHIDNNESIRIGFNVSGLLYMGGYTKNNMFGLKIDYREFINELINFLIHKKNATVVLIPHTFGTIENSESDLLACEKVYNSLKVEFKSRLHKVQGVYNQNEIKYIIGLCNFFIGSRMHACIAALSQNIPAVGIAYSKKFFGVYQSIGLESLVADPRQIDNKELINIINDAFENRYLFKSQLEQQIPRVKQTVLNLFGEADSTIP